MVVAGDRGSLLAGLGALTAGTPDAVKQKLASALKSAVEDPELKKRMGDAGAAIVFLQGDEAKAYLAKQDDTYRGIIEALGLRVATNH